MNCKQQYQQQQQKQQQQQQQQQTGIKNVVKVVFVRKQHAKLVKIRLQKAHFLDDRFRMVSADIAAVAAADGCVGRSRSMILQSESQSQSESSTGDINIDIDVNVNCLIAVPIKETLTPILIGDDDNDFDVRTITSVIKEISWDGDNHDNHEKSSKKQSKRQSTSSSLSSILVGFGYQSCPYSTKILGNYNKHQQQRNSIHQIQVIGVSSCSVNDDDDDDDDDNNNNNKVIDNNLSLSQLVLLDLIPGPVDLPTPCIIRDITPMTLPTIVHQNILDRVLKLDSTICPGGEGNNENGSQRQRHGKKKKNQSLEIFGDDRTVVIPPHAFDGKEFLSILQEVRRTRKCTRQQQQKQIKLQCSDGDEDEDDSGSSGDGDDDPKRDNEKEQMNNKNNYSPKNDNNTNNNCEKFFSNDEIDKDSIKIAYDDFWRRLAIAHNSSRIVRRGVVDRNSKIRESGHRLIWSSLTLASSLPHRSKSSLTLPPSLSPSNTSSWITVTEQGIRQSFDFTKVMFSRGNISEKIRFGKKLVQENDILLDMYTGIGYYTLPAIIHGKASFVYACEWNQHAITALRHNIKDNKIDENKVMIIEGDCREQIKKYNVFGKVDRVSLGLLPSSEGGWKTAIQALKVPDGGWLHIHGNVPGKEIKSWTLWVCHKLDALLTAVEEEKKEEEEENRGINNNNDNIKTERKNWYILCNHVERVKSFAPTVFHYVADIYVGPEEKFNRTTTKSKFNSSSSSILLSSFFDDNNSNNNKCDHDDNDGVITTSISTCACRAWMRSTLCDQETWIPALNDGSIRRPSCALSPNGVLSQEWMR